MVYSYIKKGKEKKDTHPQHITRSRTRSDISYFLFELPKEKEEGGDFLDFNRNLISLTLGTNSSDLLRYFSRQARLIELIDTSSICSNSQQEAATHTPATIQNLPPIAACLLAASIFQHFSCLLDCLLASVGRTFLKLSPRTVRIAEKAEQERVERKREESSINCQIYQSPGCCV